MVTATDGAENSASIGKDIQLASALLIAGKLVAIPTETVYGLAANGLDSVAVAKIFAAKNRPTFDPLILHVGSITQAKTLVRNWPESAQLLAEAFWPGPLTLVLPKSETVPNLVTADQDTVAIRIPNNALTLALLGSLPFPLAAPSANPFGYVSPTNAQHVSHQLGQRIDYILDGGSCEIGIESTIIAIELSGVRILRLGGLTLEDIEKVLGYKPAESLSMHSNPQAPGQLDQHYSPGCVLREMGLAEDTLTTLSGLSFSSDSISSDSISSDSISSDSISSDSSYIVEGLVAEQHTIGFLWYSKHSAENQPIYQQLINSNYKHYYLSDMGDESIAAANLFAILRQFDIDGCDYVYFEWAPATGLGRAINDRLKRASANGPSF